MGISLRLAPQDQIQSRRAQKLDTRAHSPEEKAPFAPEETQAPPPVPVVVGRNQNILVADDNPVVLRAFELKLKANGFNVTTTSTGASVASTAEMAKAELIILDVNFIEHGAMEWNGFTVMQWLARFPELARIPVILMSGNDSPEYRQKARAAGAVAFFQKPIDYKELLAAITKVLEKKPAA
jgi:two-component system KDP operon response regulator KdpE